MAVIIPNQKKNILVLGGAGFIGSHLCEHLLHRGDNVVCLDNFVTSDVENIKMMLEFPNFEFIRHDITEDIDFVKEPGLRKFKVHVNGIQEIYNLACPTSASSFTKLPVETALANSLAVRVSLEMARKYKARYLFASSSAVYGKAPEETNIIDEGYLGTVNFIGPRACYNEGKRFAETLITTYRDHYKVEVRIARIFTTYGPRMLKESGRFIPDMISNALRNADMVIQGDVSTGSSLCYVKDTVEGIVSLMQSELTTPVNLGNDNFMTYNDIAEKIRTITGSMSSVTFTDALPYTHQQSVPDITLAKEKLNWFPLVNIDDGLKQTIVYTRSSYVERRDIRSYTQ
ncbi:MAG: GDP-mannose 4,6-dehydratase [Patescibacteria group bacterium]